MRPMANKRILSEEDIRAAVTAMAKAILAGLPAPRGDWAVVGIHRRGVPLAQRLARALEELGAPPLPVGSLDITFYRDDMAETALHPVVHETELPFDIAGKTLLLVDDVLFTGRTIRSALDELMDFGRPDRIALAVLIDRGHRELPIQADFAGRLVATRRDERVDVHLSELDGEDAVWLSAKTA
ncbi:MAG: bifunctional pyr operon transcriptional regulator/uracil phosphoribosyltransferase PyrR [Elusimicrobia bacterium]|jgi:pyrimidine operon attenuation protein/uracil phosphoribosyltransferase|nr:bifunctional pyr operon transcriptional regulator/uracil phosphoribosyltransferase PyrR [Elusimicrobiota bacterium]MBK7207752.1 bifunctional pyr operon transcriptional regulator/uracil phosphoribosyltransferase PyrR [Elusimicrobiota bacterium]MBK7544513.1 bifunctional pyr operon transcriptional regulator/uracil phosphoribosyltransferase PyrR [Elusimicrobiota bacterium]MBK7574036.1 bifunctional pyr operon transcriptional regulator/uracil phosphoribosyltransferase PyrR [Elusimicrobiota bacteriu